MDINGIVAELDQEIERLTKIRTALQGTPAKRGPGRPPKTASTSEPTAKKSTQRTMSAEGKARIAAAQKARWAKLKEPESTPKTPGKKAATKATSKS